MAHLGFSYLMYLVFKTDRNVSIWPDIEIIIIMFDFIVFISTAHAEYIDLINI